MFNPLPIFVKRGHEAARAIAAPSHPGFCRREGSIDNSFEPSAFWLAQGQRVETSRLGTGL
jgi:hypothetical protein